jgi:Family of unknown function (DUF6452)
MKKTLIFLLLISLVFSGCESDDICDSTTPTTPQLVIEFFNDVTNAPANVNKLKIQDSETSNLLGTFNDAKIKIPLKTDLDFTKYSFTLNSDTPAASNLDQLKFNCTRNTVFISRACGYKTNYVLNNTTTILVKESSNVTEWIKRITVTKPNILNEDETHVKIYF